MPTIPLEQLKKHKQMLTALETERSQWESLWRELSDNFLPQRYRWLMSEREYTAKRARRQYIINNTGTTAARALAAGMMNGITSPSRPWFKLRVPGLDVTQFRSLAVWLEEVERRLLQIMAESNFYNSMAVMYLDMAVFGTAANLIYEDFDNVIHCYNPPMGEFFLANNANMTTGIFARRFVLKVHQYIERWPDERYWSERVKNCVKQGGARLMEDVEIAHFIAPNRDKLVPTRFSYYELYWEARRSVGEGTAVVLEKRGYREKPGIFARWEVNGIDPYGVSPAMDALGDTIELQHLHRNKAQLLEKMHDPALLIDVMLQNKPTATMPKGRTFVPNLANTVGAKPIYTVNPNFSEITLDKQGIEERIRTSFYNYLFTGISNLPTVRSAEEIRSRESEKLVLLGGVLERFESEALDPAINRIYALADRAGLLPPPPPEFAEAPIQIQYVSLLSVAQRAVGTAPTEQFLALLGNLAGARPDVLDVARFDTLLLNYGRDIGIRESDLNGPEEIADIRARRASQEQTAQMAQAAPGLAQAGKTLSETDVGGGGNALEQLLGG